MKVNRGHSKTHLKSESRLKVDKITIFCLGCSLGQIEWPRMCFAKYRQTYHLTWFKFFTSWFLGPFCKPVDLLVKDKFYYYYYFLLSPSVFLQAMIITTYCWKRPGSITGWRNLSLTPTARALATSYRQGERRQISEEWICEIQGVQEMIVINNLGCFPSVRTDQPHRSSSNENFTFNQNYPTRSVKC